MELILLIVAAITAEALMTHSEVLEWNGGVCLHTRKRWRYFDTDSQGGRGYKSGDYVIWISRPWVDWK